MEDCMSTRSGRKPRSCDTFVVLPPATAMGRIIFGKNSDRPGSEVQEVVYVPAADHESGAKVQPAWMWGAEMGANDQGVCIGNEAVWTRLNGPGDLEERLLGMDILRLALERASSASEAVDVIGQLIESPGQGGPCSDEPEQGWSYHNSFLIADRTTAWVLETAGKCWAAEHVTEGVRNISNELSICTKIDRSSPNLVEEAKKLGLYSDDSGPFNFAKVFSDSGKYLESQMSFRYRHGLKMLRELSSSGEFGVRDMFKILRDEESGICMTDGSFVSTGSQFGDDDPVKKLPRFQSQVDRRHALYRGHETLRELLGKEDAKGIALLGNLRELEEKCVEDMEELLGNFEESTYHKVAAIFQHMTDIELNFYK
ncbi:hypothetical protein BaRGS_00035737 [Batillaria attramentaria]|uniref:Secernin-2 n=1 Tax=Batillaria attramentaria TaxID=370345 RepID=A0ABD0JDS5_9CAEN